MLVPVYIMYVQWRRRRSLFEWTANSNIIWTPRRVLWNVRVPTAPDLRYMGYAYHIIRGSVYIVSVFIWHFIVFSGPPIMISPHDNMPQGSASYMRGDNNIYTYYIIIHRVIHRVCSLLAISIYIQIFGIFKYT